MTTTDGFALPPQPGAPTPPAELPDLEAFTAPLGGLGSVIPGEVIDLDKLRARRREAARRPATAVTIGGKRYELPPELPLGVLDAFGRLSLGDMTALADSLRLLWPDVIEEVPNPDHGKPLVGAPHGTLDERATIEVVASSPARELMYDHGLTLEDFQELLERVIAGFGIDGGLPSS